MYFGFVIMHPLVGVIQNEALSAPVVLLSKEQSIHIVL
jgi:hypothetical protein